jgi:hypothetical protein
MDQHQQALIAIMGATITNLMDALQEIEDLAFTDTATKSDIAAVAGNAIEAAKALTKEN